MSICPTTVDRQAGDRRRGSVWLGVGVGLPLAHLPAVATVVAVTGEVSGAVPPKQADVDRIRGVAVQAPKRRQRRLFGFVGGFGLVRHGGVSLRGKKAAGDFGTLAYTPRTLRDVGAGVAELADAQDLKSWVPEGTCGFDPRPRH